jgi:heptosyltransferase I
LDSAFHIKITSGNALEAARAEEIAKGCTAVQVLPRQTIGEMAMLLANADGAIAVDTGFGHLAAALQLPTVSLYGATDATLTGALGDSSIHLQAKFACSPCLSRTCHYQGTPLAVAPPCFSALAPETVFRQLMQIMATRHPA